MGAIINNKRNHRLRTDSSPAKPLEGWWGGFKAFYWYQIFVLDYVHTNKTSNHIAKDRLVQEQTVGIYPECEGGIEKHPGITILAK